MLIRKLSVGTLIIALIGTCASTWADERAKRGKGQWQWLFSGKSSDLEKWMPDKLPSPHGPRGSWIVKDNVLTMEKNAGYLWTKKTFDDFVLELEFTVPEKGNSGVFIRTRPEDPVQGGMEIQLLDDLGFAEYDLGVHATGSLYGCLAPSKAVAKAAGEWQTMTITARDNMITVVLNGEQIIEADLNQWTEAGKNPDGSENKFETAFRDLPRTGHIGLQDHGDPASFRNIRVRRLKPVDRKKD